MVIRDSSIPQFLAQVRALLRRHEARRWALYALAAIGGLALLVPLLGHAIGGTRVTALAVLGMVILLGVGVIGAGIVVGVVVPRRRWNADAAVARWVGTRHKPVASDLLSSVELADAPERPGAPSETLVDALIASTSQQLEDVEPAELLPGEQVSRAGRWAIAGVLANAIAVIALPHVVADGWRRLVAPPVSPYDGAQLSAVPLVGDLDTILDAPAYTKRPQVRLPSSSGDLRGLPGTQVTLSARVLVPAQAVEIVVEGSEEVAKTIPAELHDNQIVAKLQITHSAHYRFAVTAPDGSRSIETSPRALDAETDQPPVVQLISPAEPLDVSNLRRVELAWTIEDDFGIASAELVWESGREHGKKPLQLDNVGARTQGKIVWDIAEVQVPSGGEVRYWLEAKDNDSVGGANVGRSRELHLKVVSPRERHEETLGRQQEIAEKILKNLGTRLVMNADDPAAREEVTRTLKEGAMDLNAIVAAYEKDPHASEAMRKALAQMRERLEHLATSEAKMTPPKNKPYNKGAFASFDARMIGELEDDTIILADWLDRERMEGLLDVSDEIAAHQKRLADLLAQYQRTKDPRLLDEIEREMKALDRSFAELDKHRRGMPEDVLDQYVHRDAIQAKEGTSCNDEVRKLVRAGKVQQAQQKLEQCRAQMDRSASALEGSLAGLRGEKFSDEQKKLDEVMNELADVAKDQDDIAAEANRIFEAYAEKADDVAKDHRRDAAKKVGPLLEKLRKKLGDIDKSGLTPFSKEELDIVERRLADLEHMVADGDLAEALGMAQQAKQSLDTIASELQAALEDDPKSKWADATQSALDGVEKAVPTAKELIGELQGMSPRPDQIMSGDDLRSIDRLRRREAVNKDRTRRLAEKTKALGPELPGDTGAELGKKLGQAMSQMGTADERMKARDPSGTRESTRAAADALAKARDRARSAARQAQEGAVGDEPIKIPGADEYRAPERFREDLLEAMKKKGVVAPEGYDEQIKRYYEELVK